MSFTTPVKWTCILDDMDDVTAAQMTAELKEISDFLSQSMTQNYPKIRDQYQNAYEWPELDPKRREICLCLLLGLHQAAISMTNHLLESLLKTALISHRSIQANHGEDVSPNIMVDALVVHTADGRREYGSESLGNLINAACTEGLLTKPEKKRLQAYRDQFRNAYGHADSEKTLGETSMLVQAFRLTPEDLEPGQSKLQRAAEFLPAQGLIQAMQAEGEALPYFLYIDRLARELKKRVFRREC